MDYLILLVVSFFRALFDSIVCFVNVLAAVAKLAQEFMLSTPEPAELKFSEFYEFCDAVGKRFPEFHFSTPPSAEMTEWFLFFAFLSVPLSYLLFRLYFHPRATDGQEEEEEEEVEEEEEEVEYLLPPCPVCGERLCYECQLFKRIDWTSFTSGERIIELEVPIRDEGRLRQFILEQDPDVDIRIRHRSYYDDGACADETKVVLTKYPATKSAQKN